MLVKHYLPTVIASLRTVFVSAHWSKFGTFSRERITQVLILTHEYLQIPSPHTSCFAFFLYINNIFSFLKKLSYVQFPHDFFSLLSSHLLLKCQKTPTTPKFSKIGAKSIKEDRQYLVKSLKMRST